MRPGWRPGQRGREVRPRRLCPPGSPLASPFTWAVGDNQLVHGVTAPELGALCALGLALVALSVPALRRLDIH